VVVYFVMAMALFKDGYEEVMAYLVAGLRFLRTWSHDWQLPTASALCQARRRLGEDAVRILFESVARPVAGPGTPGAWVAGLRVMAVDGVRLDLADSPANRAAYPSSERVNGPLPFPQARVVCLGECATKAVVAARIAPLSEGETTLVRQLAGSLDPTMLVTADRGFYGFEVFRAMAATGAQLLFRVKDTLTLPVHTVLDDGSYLSEVARRTGMKTRRLYAGPVPPPDATHIRVRVVEYSFASDDGTASRCRLVTTILDPRAAGALDLARAYHHRWSIETAFRQLECQLRDSGAPLRSKTPDMARQEIWALLLTHYAIRAFAAEAADTIDLEPDRVSTIRAINIVRRSVAEPTAFSPLRRR
jgi:hypothetical protein